MIHQNIRIQLPRIEQENRRIVVQVHKALAQEGELFVPSEGV